MRDLLGLIGLVLVIAFAIAGLSWPEYTERDFISRADRTDAERQLDQHHRDDEQRRIAARLIKGH